MDTARPEVSVVVPAFGRTALLAETVRCAIAQDLSPDRYEVIVVDSSPDERNRELVEALARDARCTLRVLRKQPEGPGPSRNLGAAQARAPLLAFLDSDCQPAPHWLSAGIAAFTADVGIVQGKTIPVPGAAHSVFNRSLVVEAETFLYETANIFYRREAFEQAGGFPPDINPRSHRPMGGEDVHLAWTVKRNGWSSAFAPEALVMHAVVRITPMRWLVDKNVFILPALIRRFPELRDFFFMRFFFDRIQAKLLLALGGLAAAPFSPAFLLLALPYLLARAGEGTVALRGARRVLRPVVYFPRDVATLAVLLAGSLRYRALLL